MADARCRLQLQWYYAIAFFLPEIKLLVVSYQLLLHCGSAMVADDSLCDQFRAFVWRQGSFCSYDNNSNYKPFSSASLVPPGVTNFRWVPFLFFPLPCSQPYHTGTNPIIAFWISATNKKKKGTCLFVQPISQINHPA